MNPSRGIVLVRRSATLSLASLILVLLGWSAATSADVPTAWQLLDDGDPSGIGHVVVYDTSRQVAVRLGAGSTSRPALTWELVEDAWTRRMLEQPTPWRTGAACAAYDSDRNVMVAFGGVGGSDETWEYDGVQWVQKSPANSPSARIHCGMVYDQANGTIVLFGGDGSQGTGLGDTWEYDGTDWTELTPSTAPLPRGEMGLTYLAEDETILLFGGRVGDSLFGDTWEYDRRLNRWRALSPKNSPPSAGGSALAYDSSRGVAVLFGGYVFGFHDETWEWDGKDWTQISTTEAPAPRYLMRLYFDTARQRIRGHGGDSGDGFYDDTWEYDGTTWVEVGGLEAPPNRSGHAMGFDPRTGEVVLYGGYAWTPGPLGDHTWHLVDGEWIRQSGVGQPTADRAFRIEYDPVAERLLGFGGADDYVQDLHEYDGAVPGWVSIPTSGPDGRQNHGWVYAPGLGGFVLFGGHACCEWGSSYTAEDTWVYDGSTWIEKTSSVHPPRRRTPAMGYLESSNLVILYGGVNEHGVRYGDTWAFDGEFWTLLNDDSPPGQIVAPTLVYDPLREVLVLFGGQDPLGETTWEFDGTSWNGLNTPTLPDADRLSTSMVWDEAKEVVLLFGGQAGYSALRFNDTWAYGSDPDGDGIVGGLDNCRQTGNPDQSNGDGDPAGDACDCAPGDPGSHAQPQEVSDLRGQGQTDTTISWDDQAPSVGPGVVYDLVTGLVEDLRAAGGFSTSECLAEGLTSPTYLDDRMPPIGDGFHYLVRSGNACGKGSYGPRRGELDAGSPCP
jgi:hypothetical protein